MIDEVSLGSEEQSRGIDQIGRAISQMEQVTQTTVANAEEGAAAAEELNAQSQTLQDVVSRLHAMVDGGGQAQPVRRIAPVQTRSKPKPASASFSAPAKPRVTFTPPAKPAKSSNANAAEFPLEESFETF